MRALAIVGMLACGSGLARADRDVCAPGTRHRGAAIDLDVKDADVHDVLRLLADVAHLNLVVSDRVQGKVTLHVRAIAWDAAACAIAATHRLALRLDDTILIATPRDGS